MSKIDCSARFFHYIRVISNLMLIFSSNISTRMLCYLKGVKLGKKIRFYGLPYFQRVENSIIEIGNNCTFRTKASSALLGINHKCIVATVKKGAKIQIGNNCGFSGSTITAFTTVVLGNNVRCGTNTTINDSDWHEDDERSAPSKPIVIEDNVWLGYNVVVMKGVTIGENSVIGANSIVTKDIPANVIAAGNPCKVIKNIIC